VREHSLRFRSLIIIGVLGFGLYLVADKGLLSQALESDTSYLSYVILTIYTAMTLHWGYLILLMSRDRQLLLVIEQMINQNDPLKLVIIDGEISLNGEQLRAPLLKRHLANLARKYRNQRWEEGEEQLLLGVVEEEIVRRHAPGHFTGDALLKLGLLGTIIGFILMLGPIAEIQEFDPAVLQQLLAAMSGGMAVALTTTLMGLISSTLMNFQYQVLDSSAVDFLNRLTELTHVHTERLLASD